jgi:hypothetical protein
VLNIETALAQKESYDFSQLTAKHVFAPYKRSSVAEYKHASVEAQDNFAHFSKKEDF